MALIAHSSFLANAELRLTGEKMPSFKKDCYVKRGTRPAFFGIHGFSTVFHSRLLKQTKVVQRPEMYLNDHLVPIGFDHWIPTLANVLYDSAYISQPLAIWRRHDKAASAPIEPRNLGYQVARSMKALDSNNYFRRSKDIERLAHSLAEIMEKNDEPEIKERVRLAIIGCHELSEFLQKRASLYECKSLKGRISAFAMMLMANSYFGSTFSRLGAKPFFKDLAFAVGLIAPLE